MTQEDKQLLLKDLCARLPYGIVVSIPYPTLIIGEKSKKLNIPLISIDLADNTCTVGDLYGKTSGLRMFNRKGELLCKPYLRPMSSMTEDEKEKLKEEHKKDEKVYAEVLKRIASGDKSARGTAIPHFAADWCNKKHFDYRGLIPMGLALEAPEGMYKIE